MKSAQGGDREIPAAPSPALATGQDSKTVFASTVKQCLQRHAVHAMDSNIAISDFSIIRKAAEDELKIPRGSIAKKDCSTIIKATAVSDLT
jgi:hypothetical protein